MVQCLGQPCTHCNEPAGPVCTVRPKNKRPQPNRSNNQMPGCVRIDTFRWGVPRAPPQSHVPVEHRGWWWEKKLESRRRRTKGSVVGEEWCQNAAPLRWYAKNFFAQSKMILSRAWLHDTVSCAAWNDARKGVYLKPLFKTPCRNCYWGWSKPIMLDYRDSSLMESVRVCLYCGGPWPRHPWELNTWPF